MYRTLDSVKIVTTVERLLRRIEERFPTSGLCRVCQELLTIARESHNRAGWIAKPQRALRVVISVVITFILVSLVYILLRLNAPKGGIDAIGLLQGLEAGMNIVILVGAAIVFLVTVETRIKRARAIKAIHELRALAHVIDMHQLTKDPDRVMEKGRATPSSPKSDMSAFELIRYLDYCSEMLSVTGKIAALYVQKFYDPVVLNAAEDVETLTIGLSRKIWQKVMILNSASENVRNYRIDMKKMIFSILVLLVTTSGLYGQSAPDSAEITKLLREFLAGASRNDAAIHDRFWDAELVYTGSGGRRRGKAEIMKDVRSAPAPKPDDPEQSYGAEEIRIRQYGNIAVLAFRLVSNTTQDGKTETASFLNTGTLRKRNGIWTVVSWQATRVLRPDEESKTQLAAVEASLQQALLTSDGKKLESLIDERFVWTQSGGEQVTRKKLLDQISSGQLKYAKLETKNVTIDVFGDTGVVRGETSRQRSSIPGATSGGDPSAYSAFYTMTFIYKDGGWKAVAMHSSRP